MTYILNYNPKVRVNFFFYSHEKKIEYHLNIEDEDLYFYKEDYGNNEVSPIHFERIEVTVEGETYDDFYRAIPVEVWL